MVTVVWRTDAWEALRVCALRVRSLLASVIRKSPSPSSREHGDVCLNRRWRRMAWGNRITKSTVECSFIRLNKNVSSQLPSSKFTQSLLFQRVLFNKIELFLACNLVCTRPSTLESVSSQGSGPCAPSQLCCSVLDSIGGAESYSVSVS